MSRAAAPLTWLLVATLSLPVAGQDQDEDFKRGLDARDDRKWQDVVTHMRNAIKADPKESERRVRRGLGRTEYLPYFFLGEAHSRLNDCVGALDAWTTSEKQGMVRGDRLEVIRKGRTECTKSGVLNADDFKRAYDTANKAYQDARAHYLRLEELAKGLARQAQYRDQLRQANDEIGNGFKQLQTAASSRKSADLDASAAAVRRAETLLAPIDATLTRERDVRRGGDSRASELERSLVESKAVNGQIGAATLTPAQQAARTAAMSQLAEAEKALQIWRQDQTSSVALDTAAKATDAAALALRTIRDEANKRLVTEREGQRQQLAQAGVAALTSLEASLTTYEARAAQSPSGVQPDMSATYTELTSKRDALRRQFERARAAGNLAALSNTPTLAGELETRVNELLGRFGPRSLRDRGIPAALEEAVGLFLQGDYERSVSTLSGELPADASLRLHAHLFRAASHFALYVRSGEKNQAFLNDARSEIARCKEIDPAFRPDTRVFAPRFLALFEGRLPAAAPPSR